MWGNSQRLPPAHLRGGLNVTNCDSVPGAGGETRTLMRSEPRQILSLVRIPISPLRLVRDRFSTASGHIRETPLSRQLEPRVNGPRARSFRIRAKIGHFRGEKTCWPHFRPYCTIVRPV